jgi:hypothetical protein
LLDSETPPPENTLFNCKKEISVGGMKKSIKGFFWWGERGLARAGVGAELALQPFCSKSVRTWL